MLLYEQFVELARAWVKETNLTRINPVDLQREFKVRWTWAYKALELFYDEDLLKPSNFHHVWEKVNHEPS